MTAPALEARHRTARRLGWSSYGQRRYWETRLGMRWVGGRYLESEETRARLAELAAECCGGHKEPARAGSLMCSSCNAKVNPNVASDEGAAPRRFDWRVRLVRVVLDERQSRRAAS